jgi:hypothetical protein
VRPYSTRFSRRIVTLPGSGSAGSMPSAEYLIQSATRFSSSGVGRGLPAGGMMPERRLLRALNHRSGRPVRSASPSSSNETLPLAIPSPWHS